MAVEIMRLLPDFPQVREYLSWMAQGYIFALTEEMKNSSLRHVRRVEPDRVNEIYSLLSQLVQVPDKACLLIAHNQSELMGYFLGFLKDCLAETPAQIGYVNGLYVLPPFRRQQVAQQLIENGLEWFRSKNISLIELYITQGNQTATELWKKNGFFATDTVFMKTI